MPFITFKTNLTLTADQVEQLKSGFGKVIEFVPYKSEQSLMIDFHDQVNLYLKGDNRDSMAYLRIAVFGNPTHQGYAELSHIVTQLISQILHISPQHIYIQYEDIPSWAVAGMFFESNIC